MTGLTNGTAYTAARGDGGTGAVSSIAAAPVAVPAPPLGLTAAAGDGAVTLNWTDPGNATIDKSSSAAGGTSFADIPGSDADTASHTVTGLTNGHRVPSRRAVNASGRRLGDGERHAADAGGGGAGRPGGPRRDAGRRSGDAELDRSGRRHD